MFKEVSRIWQETGQGRLALSERVLATGQVVGGLLCVAAQEPFESPDELIEDNRMHRRSAVVSRVIKEHKIWLPASQVPAVISSVEQQQH